MVDDNQAAEKVERDGWNREEIECGDHLAMVLEEGQPVLRRIPTPANASEITRHSPLAEIQVLTVRRGFWALPSGVLVCQATD
jgi:hypothetical protein